MSENNNSSNNSISFVGALQIVFIVLKLIGKITWSWKWVLAPTWISLLVSLIVVVIITYIMK